MNKGKQVTIFTTFENSPHPLDLTRFVRVFLCLNFIIMPSDQVTVVTNSMTWGGAFTAAIGGMTLTQVLAVGGFVVALAGFAFNQYHNYQMRKIARAKIKKENDNA